MIPGDQPPDARVSASRNIWGKYYTLSRKEATALVLQRAQPSAKPTQGVWGRAPSKTLREAVFFFSRKEAKALVLLRRRLWTAHNSAKPTQGVWGLAPRYLTNNLRSIIETK
jgi:hypothetical protein